MDLPVQLSVELGRTKLKLREILEMESSSVIKLPRSTGEGVMIFTDDKPLMRGEIVIIEDLAGVRISEIIAKES